MILTLCLYQTIAFHYGAKFTTQNLSGLLCIGDRSIPPSILPQDIAYERNSHGFDGQYYYFVAQDLLVQRDFHQYMDRPGFRYSRIVYMASAALASAITGLSIVSTLVLVNILGILLGAFYFGLIVRKYGFPLYFTGFYILLSGLVFGVLRDLPDPLAMGFSLAALYYWREGRLGPSLTFLALGCLTKQTTLAFVGIFLFDALVLQRQVRKSFLVCLSVVPFLGWQFYVNHQLGLPMSLGSEGLIRWQPLDIFRDYAATIQRSHSLSELWLISLGVLSALLCLVLAIWQFMRHRNAINFGFLGFSLLPFVQAGVWKDPWGYGRVLLPLPVFLLLSYADSRSRWLVLPIALNLLMFFVSLAWLGLLPWRI